MTTNRIDKVERELADLRNQLSRLAQAAIPNPGFENRIGQVKTIDSGGSTVQWQPENGTFVEALGNDPTYENRHPSDLFAATVDGSTPSVGDRGLFFRWSTRWWMATSAPENSKLIKITETGGASCDQVKGNAQCVFDAKIVSFSIVGTDADMCDPTVNEGTEIFAFVGSECLASKSVKKDEIYLAYKVGTYTKTGMPNETRDIYAILFHVDPIAKMIRIKSGGNQCELTGGDANCVYDGTVATFTGGGVDSDMCGAAPVEKEPVWAFVGNQCGSGSKNRLRYNEVYPGFRVGEYTKSTLKRDLYVVFADKFSSHYAQAKTNWYWGGAVPPIFHPDVTPSTANSTVTKGGQTHQHNCNYVVCDLVADCEGGVILQPTDDEWWVEVNKGEKTSTQGLLVELPTIGMRDEAPSLKMKLPNVETGNIILVNRTEQGHYVSPQEGRWLHETKWMPSSFSPESFQGWKPMGTGLLSGHDSGGPNISMVNDGPSGQLPCDNLFPREGAQGSNKIEKDGGRSVIPAEELKHSHAIGLTPKPSTSFTNTFPAGEQLEIPGECTGRNENEFEMEAGPCDSFVAKQPPVPAATGPSNCGDDNVGPLYIEPKYRTGRWYVAIDNSQTFADAVDGIAGEAVGEGAVAEV